MELLKDHILSVANARKEFIEEASNLSLAQAYFKSAPEVWSICEIVEHIVWAEQIGINRMWAAIHRCRHEVEDWEGKLVHHGLPIEEIIAKTWQPKEQVPEVAKPHWGGPIEYWIAALAACQPLLEQLGEQLGTLDPTQVIYPHPISGPLNLYQRLEFLSFHLQRHQEQIKRVKAHADYPG